MVRRTQRVWRAEHFSAWMTHLLHTFEDAFESRLHHAHLEFLASSRAASTQLAENYTGIPHLQKHRKRTVRGPGKRGGANPPGTVSYPVDTATLAFSVAPVFCVRKGRKESARPAQYVLENYSKTTSEQL